ncbi:NAD-dependent epimerase/dehydratase family protein [Chitinophaga sp. GCM10012297]|uniref:NAD-dependent epimerase/dehydratase family protein n=1 Tax=Chitinophaga chungangae TaxID=2821488 RepID=A0ABS3YE78_9BACT|nr:NAD-dependent epimerase/dehydratase family protein [Chitinophaga chungangae]MBO9152985.1 NAD-dependent epimerase/dehydratase family protein [Chitinophaga chungangae]
MILVTGGTGFLGSYLLRALVQSGKPVRALYRSRIPEQVNDIREKVEWVKADVLDLGALEDAMEGITEIYHCAAIVSFHPDKRDEMFKTNIEGTANVVNLAIDAGIRKIVHVSSVAALGRAREQTALTEEAEWEESGNNSNYAVSKHLSEMEIWRGIAEGLNAVIVNPSIILGSGFWHDGTGLMLKNAWKEFPYYTEGVNGFVDVRDVADAMVKLMDSSVSGERFILNGDNWPYRQLFTRMAETLGKKPPHIAAKPWMAALVWRVEKLRSLFTGKRPLITRETARTAQLKVFYNSGKITQTLPGFRFRPMEETVTDVSKAYLAAQTAR